MPRVWGGGAGQGRAGKAIPIFLKGTNTDHLCNNRQVTLYIKNSRSLIQNSMMIEYIALEYQIRQ